MESEQNHLPIEDTGFNVEGYKQLQCDTLTIVDKDKEEVSFVPNKAQEDFLNQLEKHFQVLILKARKMGFSSEALAIGVAKFIFGRNEKIVSVSFDESAAGKQLERAKSFIRSYERNTGQKIPLKYNSKNEMVYDMKDENGQVLYTNTLRVGSAKATGFGRGDDITFLHITEVSLASDIEALLAAVGEAVVKNTHVILETTANGFNSFKSYWDRTVLNETGFTALFYSPHWEYSEAYLNERRMKLGRLYDQEYPATPLLAFLTSGDTYFDMEAMRDYMDRTREPLTV